MAEIDCLGMTEWQQRMRAVAQRDMYLLKNQMWTDCSFNVGEKANEVKCHKIYLAKTSPVFAAMLYGELAKNGTHNIKLPDLELDTFRALLYYMYKGRVRLSSVSEACGLLYASKKYLLHESVSRECRAFLCLSISCDTVWETYQFACANDEPDVAKCAWQVLQRDTESCLAHFSWLEVPQQTVVELLQQEQLNIKSELTLYKASLRWASSQLERLGQPVEMNELHQTLGPVLPLIRFLAMTPQEFVQGPLEDKFVTDVDGFALLKKISSPELGVIPSHYSSNCNSRICKTFDTFFMIGSPHENIPNEQTWSESKFNPNVRALYFSKCKQLGVRLPTQLRPSDCMADTYNEDVTILLYEYAKKELLSVTHFVGEVSYDSTVDIPHKVKLQTHTGEDMFFELRVIFHTTGTYPANLPGKSGDSVCIDFIGKFLDTDDVRLYWFHRFKFIDYIIIKE